MTLTGVIVLAALNAAISLAGGWLGYTGAKRWLGYVSAFTGGVLLATAFFDILPTVLPAIYTKTFVWFFVGLLGCFAYQSLEDTLKSHGQAASVAALIGSGIAHNLLYGAVIGIGFFAGVPSATFAAIILAISDIPHEIGVFGILAHRGYPRKRAFKVQTAIAAATLPGAIIAYAFRAQAVSAIPILLTLLASWFTYLVISDLMPEMRSTHRHWLINLGWLIFGALLVYWLVYHFGHGAFGYHPLYTDHP